MAKIKWQAPAMDAVIAIGGGTLLEKYVGGVDFVANLMTKLPADLMGVDVSLLVWGGVALIVAKNWLMK